MNYQDRILKRVDALISQNPQLKPLHDLFRTYLTTDTVGSMAFGNKLSTILEEAGIPAGAVYDEAFAAAQEADLHGSKSVRSPQEYALIQSARGEEGISPTNEPYKIMALTSGASLENVQLARSRIRPKALGCYFELGADFVRISVEPIDGEGNTVRDPVPLREDETPMNPREYKYSANFPFRRR